MTGRALLQVVMTSQLAIMIPMESAAVANASRLVAWNLKPATSIRLQNAKARAVITPVALDLDVVGMV
jgi:hypothetical protein